MKLKTEKKYRPCVAIFLINKENRVFVGKRFNSIDSWQIPQGGIEIGKETLESAMFRELFEETGIESKFTEIIACYPHEIQYDIPNENLPKSWNGEFCGQKVICFFLRFTGSDKDINLLASDHPEFSEFKWEEPRNIINNIVSFKKSMYEKILDYFSFEVTQVLKDSMDV
jgi:putative (di)nucleoside polyphosphate hydrolase